MYRIFGALFFLMFLLPDFSFYSILSSLPNDFFYPPPGPMMIFDAFPPTWFLQSIHVLLVISWIGVLVGFKTKASSILAGCCMVVLQGFLFSFGKINHEMLLTITPVIMGFSNWGGRFSIDAALDKKQNKPEGWPLVLLALFIGFMMFTAGFPKILGGWLDPSTQATRGHLLNQFFGRERQELLAEFAVSFNSAFFWELLDWVTIFFEIGFLAAVWKTGWTRIFVCFAVFFHFSTMMTLNIPFLPNFLAYAAFLKWDQIYQSVHESMHSLFRIENPRRTVLIYGTGLAVLMGVIKWISINEVIISSTEPSFQDLFILSAAVIIILTMAIRKIKIRITQQHRIPETV